VSRRTPPPASKPTSGRASWIGLAVLLFSAIIMWWMFREPGTAPEATKPIRVDPPVAEPEHVAPPPAPQREIAGDGIAVMAEGPSDDSTTAPRHPHPITPVHERNFRQINMVAVLNSAMDTQDVEELRRANRQYRDEYPEANLLQDGYDVIADCLERRTAETRAAAQRYWETQVASNLRRYVRRHCLD
jgi:hypothetical protein